MGTLHLVVVILALVCFLIAALDVTNLVRRINLVAAGLCLWLLSTLVR